MKPQPPVTAIFFFAVMSGGLGQRRNVVRGKFGRHLRQTRQVLPIAALLADFHGNKELLGRDISLAKRDLFWAAALQAPPELACVDEGFVRASIELGEPASHEFHTQLAPLKIDRKRRAETCLTCGSLKLPSVPLHSRYCPETALSLQKQRLSLLTSCISQRIQVILW